MKNIQPLSNRLDPARGSNLAHVKTNQLVRDEEEKTRLRRIKGIIVLMEQFLVDQGYMQSLQTLQRESGVSLQHNCVADNMDLFTLVSDFEQFYEFQHQRKPKLFRALQQGSESRDAAMANNNGEKLLVRRRDGDRGEVPTPPSSVTASPTYGNVAATSPPVSPLSGSLQRIKGGKLRPVGGLARVFAGGKLAPLCRKDYLDADDDPGKHKKKIYRHSSPSGKGETRGVGLNMEGRNISYSVCNQQQTQDGEDSTDDFYGRALKPAPFFPTAELNDLAHTIMRDILDINPAVRWSDIAELSNAKNLLKEAVVMPVKYPELFEGIVRPWKGIFLFGPPGTGKTMLAKAVATECHTTFFNISASSVVSKWRGDSEKLVRMLFDLAVHYAPSTIFIDEVDSLMSTRSTDGEHEGSRRMKTELLTQMDGLSKRRGGNVVFVLAASNTPWDLDSAMLRRLEKRILVFLPSHNARKHMFHRLLHNNVTPTQGVKGDASAQDFDWDKCARLTHNMSGADIDIICREAIMRPIRKLLEKLEESDATPSSPTTLAKIKLERPRATLSDVEASIACTRSSVSDDDLRRYESWAKQYGSDMSI